MCIAYLSRDSCRNLICKNLVNATKTQMLVLGTPAMLRTLPPVVVRFCGNVIADSREVKNLGVYPRPYKPGTALRPNEVDEAVGLWRHQFIT